jgi:hypothetical protein
VKASLGFKAIVLTAAVLIAGSAFAANKGSLDLRHSTNVSGKELASGSYIVRWEGTGDQVDVKIYQGKSVVASIPARVLKVEHPIANDSAVVNANPDGTFSLREIRFGGKTYALQISNEDGGAAAGAAFANALLKRARGKVGHCC